MAMHAHEPCNPDEACEHDAPISDGTVTEPDDDYTYEQMLADVHNNDLSLSLHGIGIGGVGPQKGGD